MLKVLLMVQISTLLFVYCKVIALPKSNSREVIPLLCTSERHNFTLTL